MNRVAGMQWVVLVPMKALPNAKSRLASAAPDAPAHARLVTAIRHDTMAAIAATEAVATAVLVLDTPAAAGPADAAPTPVATFVQTAAGLNAGLAEAAAWAAQRWPGHGIAALVADLPALRPRELGTALEAAAGHPRSYVPDAQGTGTTLLTAAPGTMLDPHYGPGSAAHHARSAARLTGGPGLRTDVDTADDLRAARLLGVGPETAAELLPRPDTHPAAHACMIET